MRSRKKSFFLLIFFVFGYLLLFFSPLVTLQTETSGNSQSQETSATACQTAVNEKEKTKLWNHFQDEDTVWIFWLISQFKLTKLANFDVASMHNINPQTVQYENLSSEVKSLVLAVCNDIKEKKFKIDNKVTHWNRFFAHQVVNTLWEEVIKKKLVKIKQIYWKKNQNLANLKGINFFSLSALSEEDSGEKLNSLQRRVITLFNQDILKNVYNLDPDVDKITNLKNYFSKLGNILDDTENQVDDYTLRKLQDYLALKKPSPSFSLSGQFINETITALKEAQAANSIDQLRDLTANLQAKISSLPLLDEEWENKLYFILEANKRMIVDQGVKNIWEWFQLNPWLLWMIKNFNIKTLGGVWVEPLANLNINANHQTLSDDIKIILTFIYNHQYWKKWPNLYDHQLWEGSGVATNINHYWLESFAYLFNRKIWSKTLKSLLSEINSNLATNLPKNHGIDFTSWKDLVTNWEYRYFYQEQNEVLIQLNKSYLNDLAKQKKWKLTSSFAYHQQLTKNVISEKERALKQVKNYLSLLKKQQLSLTKNYPQLLAVKKTNPDLSSKYHLLTAASKNALQIFFQDSLWEEKLTFAKLKIWAKEIAEQKIVNFLDQNFNLFWTIKTDSDYQTSSQAIKKTINSLILEPNWEAELKKLLASDENDAGSRNLLIAIITIGGVFLLGLVALTGYFFFKKKQQQNKTKISPSKKQEKKKKLSSTNQVKKKKKTV